MSIPSCEALVTFVTPISACKLVIRLEFAVGFSLTITRFGLKFLAMISYFFLFFLVVVTFVAPAQMHANSTERAKV